MVQEGYDKVRMFCIQCRISWILKKVLLLQYKGSPFKVANLNRWLVIVSGHKFVEELRNADDDELSFVAAIAEVPIRTANVLYRRVV
jgi:hypothetical protein